VKLKIALIAAATSSLAVLGCGGSEKPTAVPDKPPEQDAVTTKPAKKPDKKDYEAPAADKLGTQAEGKGLAVGTAAPDASVTDMKGQAVKLSAARAGKPALIIFYRGGWCPYCNMQVHKMATEYDSFAARGVMPIMISADKPDSAAKTAATYEVKFPILSDPDLAAHKAFNVVHKATPEQVKALKDRGQDVEKSSGRKHHMFAVPSIFLVDASGTIKWAHVDTNHKVRPSTDQLLGVLDAQGFKAK
jgi:peroxiredoxin